ncbi:SpoIIE family protein phosphatase [Streptomyces sp. CB03911]|uniref:SpoIIE family protein phosphatase n=1 Tax=Streptomyces sp. CB03911 TaxID=1804758 RepID=UPI0009A0F5DB
MTGHPQGVPTGTDNADKEAPRILLSAIHQAEYEEGRIELKSGETFTMYTDGLIDRLTPFQCRRAG